MPGGRNPAHDRFRPALKTPLMNTPKITNPMERNKSHWPLVFKNALRWSILRIGLCRLPDPYCTQGLHNRSSTVLLSRLFWIVRSFAQVWVTNKLSVYDTRLTPRSIGREGAAKWNFTRVRVQLRGHWNLALSIGNSKLLSQLPIFGCGSNRKWRSRWSTDYPLPHPNSSTEHSIKI